MGNRLSKIYTRTGDQGETCLAGGQRVAKDCNRIEAIGTVDEVNCAVGMILAQDIRNELRDILSAVQHTLFDLGGELSIPGATLVKPADVDGLESALDHLNESLPPLQEFILPGGGIASANCHLARAICRRAERRLLTLSREETLSPVALIYLNRLSDLLFVIGRILARDAGGVEVLWKHDRGRS